MTSMWVSVYAGFLLALPVILWQLWGFLIPAFDPGHERMLKWFVLLATALLVAGVAFGYLVALPRATAFLTNYDNSIYNIQIRAKDYISFAVKVLIGMAIVFELPIFVVGLTRMGVISTHTLRTKRRIGYFIVACVAVALPGRRPDHDDVRGDPPRDPLRALDLDLRACSTGAPSAPRPRPRACDGAFGRLGTARRRAADQGRARPLRGRGARRGRHRPGRPPLRRRGDRAGLRERPFAPRVLGLRGLRGRHAVRPLDRAAHGTQGAPQPGGDARGRPARRGRLARVGDHDDGRLRVLGSRGDRRRRARPARDRLPRGVRGRPERRRSGNSTRSARGSRRARSCASASRRTRRTRARSTSTAGASRSASPSAPISPRAPTRTSGSSTAPGRSSAIAPILQPPTGLRAVGTLEPVLGPRPAVRALRRGRRRPRSPCSPERHAPVAHCPRSNALLGCGIAPLTDLRAAGVVVGLGTDSPASAPSFDIFEEMRAAIYAARGRERRADALLAEDALRLATLDAARAVGLDAQVGTLTPGKRADLAVVSLAESPYHPVEDPAAAVVFGGSPERVLETIVDGQTRYTSEESIKWQEVRSTASAARRRMLATAAVARPRKKQKPPQWQEQLFFQRLRNHAKWVFVLLALRVRARLRLLRRRLGLDRDQRHPPERAQLRLERRHLDLQPPVRRSPRTRRTPQSWRDLATAYEQKQRTQDAVSALERYSALKPKDDGALAELASEYGTLAQTYATDYTNAQQEAASQAPPGAAFAPAASTPFGKAFNDPAALQDPIAAAVQTLSSTKQQTAYTSYQTAQQQRGERVPEARRPPAERPDDAGPARPGRPGRERHEDGHRRVRGVPEARADRPARPTGQEGAEDACGNRQLPPPRRPRAVRLSPHVRRAHPR